MGWNLGNGQNSICGEINLFKDDISLRWWLPKTIEIPDPILKGGQCANKWYRLKVSGLVARPYDRVIIGEAIGQSDPIFGKIDSAEIADIGWDWRWPWSYKINASPNWSFGGFRDHPDNQIFNNGWISIRNGGAAGFHVIWAVQLVGIFRDDGASEEDDIAECGTKKILSCSNPEISNTPDGFFKFQRSTIGSRIAIIEDSSLNPYRVKIIEYLPLGIPFAPPLSGGGIAQKELLSIPSPIDCQKFARVEFLCGKEGKKCPPNTCFKCLNTETQKICCFGNGGKLLGIADKEAENDYC